MCIPKLEIVFDFRLSRYRRPSWILTFLPSKCYSSEVYRWIFIIFGMKVPQIYVYILLDLFVEIYPTFCVITNYVPKNCYFLDFSILPFLETNILLIILNINKRIQQNGNSPLLSLFLEFQPNRVVNFRGVAFCRRYTKNNKIQDGRRYQGNRKKFSHFFLVYGPMVLHTKY